ncbi:hypothetical protein CF149_20311 [Pseudomonas psychrophila]|nr:hypothetical protein CF149_20311 [Pseudomonas psychrophila]
MKDLGVCFYKGVDPYKCMRLKPQEKNRIRVNMEVMSDCFKALL